MDRTVSDPHDFEVPYRASYPAFRREVERQLCPVMICRSDGGERMRELIARHQDLESLHSGYGDAGAGDGDPVGIRAILERQEDRSDRIIDLRFAQVGVQRNFGDDRVEVETPDARPVIDDVVEEMDDTMGPLPEAEHGDDLYAVGLPYRAFVEGYGGTIETLLRMNTNQMDDEMLPIREPRTITGCGAPALHDRNRAGCRAALHFWRNLTEGQRRLLRLPRNIEPTLDRLRRRDCEVTRHFCPTCACEEQF